jgi:hypothetical protein
MRRSPGDPDSRFFRRGWPEDPTSSLAAIITGTARPGNPNAHRTFFPMLTVSCAICRGFLRRGIGFSEHAGIRLPQHRPDPRKGEGPTRDKDPAGMTWHVRG